MRQIGWPEIYFELFCKARALIFPGEEDFGIVPIEAMACLTPVVAYDKGGARESISDGKTGVLFAPQTVAGLTKAIEKFEQKKFNPTALKDQADKFSKNRFKAEIKQFVKKIQ